MVQPTSLEKLIVVALKGSPPCAKKGWTTLSAKACARAHCPNQARAPARQEHPSIRRARAVGRAVHNEWNKEMPKHAYHSAVQKGVDDEWLTQSGNYWKLNPQYKADARKLVAKWLDGQAGAQSPKTVKKTIKKTRKLASSNEASPKPSPRAGAPAAASPKPSTPVAAPADDVAAEDVDVAVAVAVEELIGELEDGDIDGEAMMEAMGDACGSGSASENGEEQLYRIAFG